MWAAESLAPLALSFLVCKMGIFLRGLLWEFNDMGPFQAGPVLVLRKNGLLLSIGVLPK